MKRKDYKTPTTLLVKLQQHTQLLSGSPQGDLGEKQTAITATWDEE